MTSVFAAGFLDPKTLIETVGLFGIFAIVFAESGLLIGFFLPGDSLLFTAGFLASGAAGPDLPHLNLPALLIGVSIAAITGDQVGYLFGRKMGPALFSRPDSRLFKQENVEKAQEFFDKYGKKAIILARFVPIVRTFTPVIAGVGQMHYRTFVTFNVIGGLLWGVGVTLLGYFLGQIEVVEKNLEIAILAVVGISVLPIALELWKSRRGGGHGKKGPKGPAVHKLGAAGDGTKQPDARPQGSLSQHDGGAASRLLPDRNGSKAPKAPPLGRAPRIGD